MPQFVMKFDDSGLGIIESYKLQNGIKDFDFLISIALRHLKLIKIDPISLYLFF